MVCQATPFFLKVATFAMLMRVMDKTVALMLKHSLS
jgi:hypothetical protein